MSEAPKMYEAPANYPPEDDKRSSGEEGTHAEKKLELENALKKLGERPLEPVFIDSTANDEPETPSASPSLPKPRLVLDTTTGQPEAPIIGTLGPEEFTEKLEPAEDRFEKLRGWFAERSKEIDKQAATLGGGKAEQTIRYLGEKYNGLNWKSKLAISVALAGSVALTSTALPVTSAILAGTMYGQRAIGSIGFALNRRKGIEARIAANPKHWLATATERQKDWYAIGLAIAYAGTTSTLSHEAVAELKSLGVGDWLGKLMGHGTTNSHEALVAPTAKVLSEAKTGDLVSAPPTPETAAAPEIKLAPEHLGHHAIHDAGVHAEGLSADAKEKLETAFLNKWQADNPGMVPSDDQINAYIAQHSSAAAVPPEAAAPETAVAPPPAEISVPDHIESPSNGAIAPIETPALAPETIAPVPVHPEAVSGISPVETPPAEIATPEVHPETPPDVTPVPEAPAPVEVPPATELPPLEDHGFVDAHPVPHPLVETSAMDVPSGPGHVIDHAADAAPTPALDPAYALEHGEAFTNAHNVVVDPQHPAIYRYMQGGEKVTFVSGGGASGDGFLARMDLILNQLAADPHFWGTKVYWDASEVKLDGVALPHVGQLSIDKSGIIKFDKPGFFGRLFERRLELPDPNEFLERVNITPQS